MQKVGVDLRLSSVDLVGHLNCRYLTELDLKVANGEIEKPRIWDPVLETLAERGAAHEHAFIDHLKADGVSVTVNLLRSHDRLRRPRCDESESQNHHCRCACLG
jgi:hypothetical protein